MFEFFFFIYQNIYAMNDLDFYKWMIIKDQIDTSKKQKVFQEAEIWWCNCGKNVGTEINGKHDYFLRPFIVFKKFSPLSFLGIPLTSKDHTGSWYYKFTFKQRSQYAVLSQIRALSVKRLHRKIGELSTETFNTIQSRLLNLCS